MLSVKQNGRRPKSPVNTTLGTGSRFIDGCLPMAGRYSVNARLDGGDKAMELTSGKTAVVTGAGSGIGFALAERFARAGLDIVLADIEQEALDAAEQKIAALGVQTLAVRTDVSDEVAVQALAAAAIEGMPPTAQLADEVRKLLAQVLGDK
jgi:methylase of polypeptide subunit release factors